MVANWLIWPVFAFELAAILIVATRKRAALRTHWLDVAIVVLTVPLVTEALSWLRIARFVRLARLGALTTVTVQGRLIRIVPMFTGIGFLSLLTAAVATGLRATRSRPGLPVGLCTSRGVSGDAYVGMSRLPISRGVTSLTLLVCCP